MRLVATVLACAAAVAFMAAVYLFTGAYDVAASHPSSALTAWVMEETMEKSVRKHAASIEIPPLQGAAQLRTGYEHYKAMCEMCHGAPGVEATEIAKGLEPPAPLLYETDEDTEEEEEPWTAAELFWITKHGIKMTGMPAWGPTHTDEEIWALVAFLEKLPHLTAQEYSTFASAAESVTEHRHEHAETHGGATGTPR
jgi:mono/diheme cytochrome c family protein